MRVSIQRGSKRQPQQPAPRSGQPPLVVDPPPQIGDVFAAGGAADQIRADLEKDRINRGDQDAGEEV